MNNSGQQSSSGVTRAGRREWAGLAVLALACLLYAMDLTVLHLAVPAISEDLRPSGTQLLWITDIYGFMVAGFLITMGTLGDRLGRRRLLLGGAACFGVVSVLAAFSASPEMLIGARALLGIAGATLAPSTLSLIFIMFQDPRQRSTAIGIWITAFSAGGAIGPMLGGVLLERFWWGSVFLLAVPVMALLLVLGPRVLPEYRDPAAGRLDLVSAALLLAAVLAVVFGIKQTAQAGLSWAAAAILGGLAVGLGFARRQLTLADPMIDLRLFRTRAFNASLAANLLGIFIVVGYFLFVAQYLQLVLGLSPLQAGLWSLPSAGGFIVGSNLAPWLLRRVRPAYVIGSGLALAAAGLGVLTGVGGSPGADLGIIAAGSLLVSLGLAPVFTATTDLIVSSAPPERAGAASGISETGAELGGALGIAVLGSIGVAVYRGHLAGSLPPGIPSQAAAAAQDTLGGAVAAARQLPSAAGAALLGAAREAFTIGLQLTVALSAVLAAGIAVGATVLLRAARASSQAEPAGQPVTAPEAVTAPEPDAVTQPEEPVQLIRAGGGCVACAASAGRPPPRSHHRRRRPGSGERRASAGLSRPRRTGSPASKPEPGDPPRGSLTNAGRTHRDARPASELERPDQDTKERTIMSGNQAPPQPHPALRRLDCLVGTWTMAGSLVGSDDKNITGQTTFRWLPGGFFLEQRARIDFAGQQIDALELIGYDPQTDTFPSTVFSGFSPTPLPYRWDVRGDSVTITVAYAPLDATFTGSWRQDGTFSGGWRPNPGANETVNVPYDIGGHRLQ